MVFKNFRYHLIARIIILSITIFILSGLYFSDGYQFTQLLLLVLTTIQAYNLYQFLDRSNKEIEDFLEKIKNDELDERQLQEASKEESIYPGLRDAIHKIIEIKADKEAQHQYLKTIVQHVSIGIITFEPNGEIQIINSAAKSILGIGQLQNIEQLNKFSPDLVKAITQLRTGGRDLIRLNHDNEEVQIAIYAIELSLKDQTFKLISLQNIQSELDEKEMDAWQNLIRVLTHEIMNSVTPISSLAKTLEDEIKTWFEKNPELERSVEDIDDFNLALNTIHRRSENLIAFVSEFRNMTRITLPNLKEVSIREVINQVLVLLKNDIGDIKIVTNIYPTHLKITLDERQIEQVFINLVKNAVQALQPEDSEKPDSIPQISITANPTPDGGAIVSVKDNGPGIDEEALQKIFIPFFTTKKGGSGIGLTLSKQIMRLHHGSISVSSKVNEGTEFTLRFSQVINI